MGGRWSNFIDSKRVDATYLNTAKINLTSTWYNNIFIGIGGFYTSYASTNSTIGIVGLSPTSNIAGVGTAMWCLSTLSTVGLYFSFVLPNDYKEGTAITPYLYWASSLTTASSAYYTVGLAYVWSDIGTSYSSYATQATALQLVSTGSTSYTVVSTNFATISSTTHSVGSVFTGSIYIDTTIANSSAAGSIFLRGLNFVYQVDGIGSTYSNTVDK
jgi:hypothetical protein